ncbi:MAG: hypothetical protein RBT59_04570 [Arcobacteraceae bacterium]|jgi:hypothetical protein|nr:hypothetical protein [Arcobacteraceae bacterium]
MLEKIKKQKWIVDYALGLIILSGIFYAHDEYKNYSEKVYVIDAAKIYQLKNKELDINTATEKDVMEYYDSLQKLVVFSDEYINKEGRDKDAIIYSKNAILTTKSKKVVDLTDELIVQLKQTRLLK